MTLKEQLFSSLDVANAQQIESVTEDKIVAIAFCIAVKKLRDEEQLVYEAIESRVEAAVCETLSIVV